MGIAAELNISINQGSTFSMTSTVNDSNGDPIDLTSATISSMIRQNVGDASPAATFDVVGTDLANGQFEIRLEPAVTAALSFSGNIAVWDLDIEYSPTEVDTVFFGRVTLNREVTR